MAGVISMIFGAVFALVQEMNACKAYYPGINEQQAFELSVRTYGCVPKPLPQLQRKHHAKR